MLDKSSVYVVAEGMNFLEKKSIKFQLFGLSTACLKLFKFLMWFLKPGLSFCINFAPITLVLLTWKWIGLFLRKNHLLRCWGWPFLLNWIGVLTLSLLLKLPPRKLEPWFVLWSFFFLRLLYIFISLPYDLAWNAVVMSGLVLLVTTWICWISYKNRYAGMLVLHLLLLLNPWLIVEMYPAQVFTIGITLVDVYLNWPNWFHFLILEGGLLAILIGCMNILSPFLDAKGCLYQQFLSSHSWTLEFSAYRMLSFDLWSK